MPTLDALETLVKGHPFLAGIDPSFCEFFAECASLRRFASQQQVFHEGGEADHFYLILFGNVALETWVAGHGNVTIQTLGSGDALGWSWFFPPHEWHYTATTRAPTDVISFGAAALRARAEANRDFREDLLARISKTLLQRLESSREQIISLYSRQV
jgi:CRP/FNR family cyclic AMP-dependent transcriptional regulator